MTIKQTESITNDLDDVTCAHAGRAEGGLLSGTILQIGGGGSGMGWGCNTIEVRESTGGNGWKWRPITAVENQWLIDALNAKATSPTRDGAEGAGEHPNLKAGMAGMRAATQFRRAPAPPKPVPNAMRNAIADFFEEKAGGPSIVVGSNFDTVTINVSPSQLLEAAAALRSPSPAVAAEPETVRQLLVEACDLLAERKHGNPARSAGHNARLALEAALRFLPVQPGAGEWQDMASAPNEEIEVRGIWHVRGGGVDFTHWRPRQAPHSSSETES